jgi:hypothetical protein
MRSGSGPKNRRGGAPKGERSPWLHSLRERVGIPAVMLIGRSPMVPRRS